MCKEALPEHINDPWEWKGSDHDTWLFRWFIPLKLKYLAFGPRDSHKWHKWREWPITIFAIKGKGSWRFENDEMDSTIVERSTLFLRDGSEQHHYLSRIQKWARWSFQFQWPFFIAFHFYFKAKDVLNMQEVKNRDGKLLFFYVGAHRDSDKVYWIPSLYIGMNWK